jgi:DNA-binding transcriptional ArsR family regulator
MVSALNISQPATSKHLRVLRTAGLVRVEHRDQQGVYTIDPTPLAELDRWLQPYRDLWVDRLDALGRYLDDTEEQ